MLFRKLRVCVGKYHLKTRKCGRSMYWDTYGTWDKLKKERSNIHSGGRIRSTSRNPNQTRNPAIKKSCTSKLTELWQLLMNLTCLLPTYATDYCPCLQSFTGHLKFLEFVGRSAAVQNTGTLYSNHCLIFPEHGVWQTLSLQYQDWHTGNFKDA